MSEHREDQRAIAPKALDHVALWVSDRDALARFLCDHLGMHQIERTERFTLVGADARRGKITLFAADGPRHPGALERVVFGVADLAAAISALPSGTSLDRPSPDLAYFAGPEQLGLGLIASNGGPDYDIDHIVLRVTEPDRTAEDLAALGFEQRDGALVVADKYLRLVPGSPSNGDLPLLNHIALLVDSAEDVHAEAKRRGLSVDDYVDGPNTLAVFVWGPDRIKLEYVQHKPGFSLT